MKELIGTYLVTRSETEMLKLRSKVPPSVLTVPERSKKSYMRDTIESTNKQKIKKEQGKNKSPLRSPRQRLCEEELEIFSQTDLKLQKVLKANYYHPQKYDDQMQTQWGEKKTFVQTSPHDDVIDFYGHKPRPPSGSSSSKKSRKQRINGPQTLEQFEEYLAKAKRANENDWVFGDECTAEENVRCKRKIFEDPSTDELPKEFVEYKRKHEESAKRDNKIEHQIEFEKLYKTIEKIKKVNDALWKKNELEDRMRKVQTKLERNEGTHQLCLEREEEQSRYINDLKNDIETYQTDNILLQKELEKLNCSYSTVKAENATLKYLQNEEDAKTKEINSLRLQLASSESLNLELKFLLREKANVDQQNSELTKTLLAKEMEIESLIQNRERSEERIRNLNNEISDIQKSKRHTVNESLQQLLTENFFLKSTLDHRDLEIENLSKECEKQRQTREKGKHEMTELEQVVQKKKNEVEELKARLEEFSKKCSALQRDKEEAHAKISDLTGALYEKKRDVESLTNQLERYKDLSKELTNVKQDKENAEYEISSLSNDLYHKDKEIESVQNKLTRAENEVSILSKDIKNIQESKRLADEKLQGLQTENSSLKSALSKATFEIEDLLSKDTNLQKYKTDAEHKTSTLMNALKEKETEIEALSKQLARAEKNVSILSQDNKDIQASKRQVAEEKLQGLQTENASMKSALSKTTNKIEDLLNKCTNLQKYKTDAEHKSSTLMNALEEKETEIEALSKQLARSEKNVSILSQDIKDIQASKRQGAEEKLQDLQTENASLKSALSKTTNEIEDLLKKGTNLQKYKTDAEHKTSTLMNALKEKETEIEALSKQLARAEKNVSILSQDITDIKASKRQVAEEKLQDLQTENASLKSALSKATNKIEDLLNKGTNLQKYKTDAEHKTSTLKNAMKEKEYEIEALREQLARAEKNVSILSHHIKDIQATKRQVAEEKLQNLQTENASLKSALSKANNEIEDLLNKGTNLQKYKTDAEHKTSTLMNDLKEKETKIEALSKQLARSEENVSILSKDIKNIKESKLQVAEEKLQDLQTENDSLKLTLAETTAEIEDLWNKCTNLQKYKSDTEHEIRTLLNAVEEKDTEIENLRKHLARSEKKISILSKDIEDIQGSKRQAADEKVQSLKTENASLKLELAKATTEKNNELSKDVSNLRKEKENVENHRNSLSKALAEKEKEIEIMRNDIARYTEKISTLTKYVEDIQGSKTQAAEESIKVLQKKNDSLESDLRSATSEINELSRKYKHLQKDKENAERKINNLSKSVQEREKEIESLVEKLAKADENVNKAEKIASADVIQKLKEDNASLQSDLVKQKQETEKKVSDLTKELKNLQKSKGTGLEEYNARKLYDENEFLKAQLDRTSRNYEQLRKDYNEVKREKDHALNRLSSVAGEKLRNNNPGIADLSDENRPINLGEKFSQLYDDQWTDAIEHLEEMGYSETDGIRCLLDILKSVFDECVKLSDIHFNQLKELTGTSHLPSDQLKKLKDLRKATAIHSVAKTKHLVNDYMSKTFSKEKAACQTYIDRSIELCWLMSVQDPPVVIDFIAVHGQAIDDKILRKFTKTGSKIDFLVWPVIRLHKNGPLLQKGVVQPI